ncbi:hypothetical protein D3C87_1985350 [compost metagenome]
MPIEEAMRRFCVTARICRPKADFFISTSSAKKIVSENSTIHMRFQVIVRPPSGNDPDIHEGLPTSWLVGPKMVRIACCRISEMPQVASSVSSGRP